MQHVNMSLWKELVIADTLSRSPIPCAVTPNTIDDVQAYVDSIEMNRPMSTKKQEVIAKETSEDPQLRVVLEHTKHGWPKYSQDIPDNIIPYFHAHAELSVIDGKVIYRDRIVIPKVMRSDILDKIHDGHMGLTKCRERANMSVWWPGICQDIKTKILTCEFVK